MARNKASRAQKVRPGYWLIITSSDRSDPWRHRFENDPRLSSLGHVRFLDASVKLYSEYEKGRPDLYKRFFGDVKKELNSLWDEENKKGVPPWDWKVVLGFTHGDAQGGVTMHPDGANIDTHWGVASQWWTPFYSVGVRRLHYHTCHVGRYFGDPETFPVIKRGPEGEVDDVMTVTAWDYQIYIYDETLDRCAPTDDYLFRGMPLCRSMDKASSRDGLRGFNSIIQLRVCITSRGAEVRHRMTPTVGKI